MGPFFLYFLQLSWLIQTSSIHLLQPLLTKVLPSVLLPRRIGFKHHGIYKAIIAYLGKVVSWSLQTNWCCLKLNFNVYSRRFRLWTPSCTFPPLSGWQNNLRAALSVLRLSNPGWHITCTEETSPTYRTGSNDPASHQNSLTSPRSSRSARSNHNHIKPSFWVCQNFSPLFPNPAGSHCAASWRC